MKTIFEEMGGTYRQVGDYFIPNITLPDDGEYQIGKYGRMRRSYLKEYRLSLIHISAYGGVKTMQQIMEKSVPGSGPQFYLSLIHI